MVQKKYDFLHLTEPFFKALLIFVVCTEIGRSPKESPKIELLSFAHFCEERCEASRLFRYEFKSPS